MEPNVIVGDWQSRKDIQNQSGMMHQCKYAAGRFIKKTSLSRENRSTIWTRVTHSFGLRQ